MQNQLIVQEGLRHEVTKAPFYFMYFSPKSSLSQFKDHNVMF